MANNVQILGFIFLDTFLSLPAQYKERKVSKKRKNIKEISKRRKDSEHKRLVCITKA